MRRICILLFLVVSFYSLEAALSLQEKFASAEVGDFIVTTQEGHHSLLCIRSLDQSTLLLEEIAVPLKQIDLKKIQWKTWVQQKAPGHTSWTLYEVNLETGELVECFSLSKNGWIHLDKSEQLLTRLLTLPLSPIPTKERKRIGARASGEDEHRALWNPPLVFEGEKKSKAEFQVLKTTWPNDGSLIASCTVELYFAKDMPRFPFPYWLEIKSPHYTFKVRAIDSGKGLVSPYTASIPHRPPQILGPTQRTSSLWKLPITTPAYFSELRLFALDLSNQKQVDIPGIVLKKGQEEGSELAQLEIPTEQLQALLQPQHRYRWVLVPKSDANVYVESEEVFSLKR